MAHNHVLGFIRAILGWFTLADYEAAKDDATREVIRRYGRGNVTFQNGWALDEKNFEDLTRAGDKAVEQLNKAAARAQ